MGLEMLWPPCNSRIEKTTVPSKRTAKGRAHYALAKESFKRECSSLLLTVYSFTSVTPLLCWSTGKILTMIEDLSKYDHAIEIFFQRRLDWKIGNNTV
jgi:hypothetical protein